MFCLFLYVLSSANRVKSLNFLQLFFYAFCQKCQYVLAFICYNELYNKYDCKQNESTFIQTTFLLILPQYVAYWL